MVKECQKGDFSYMKNYNFFKSLPFKLIVGVVVGIIVGLILNSTDGAPLTSAILNIIVTLKYVLGKSSISVSR